MKEGVIRLKWTIFLQKSSSGRRQFDEGRRINQRIFDQILVPCCVTFFPSFSFAASTAEPSFVCELNWQANYWLLGALSPFQANKEAILLLQINRYFCLSRNKLTNQQKTLFASFPPFEPLFLALYLAYLGPFFSCSNWLTWLESWRVYWRQPGLVILVALWQQLLSQSASAGFFARTCSRKAGQAKQARQFSLGPEAIISDQRPVYLNGPAKDNDDDDSNKTITVY